MEENRMILNISTVESEKAKNDKFASDNGITQEEMDEVYQEIFENLPDNVTGDNRVKRALRKTRGALKKKINVQGVPRLKWGKSPLCPTAYPLFFTPMSTCDF